MKSREMGKWKYKTAGREGEVSLFGVSIFDVEWQPTGERADVIDPIYGQSFSFHVYTVLIKGEEYIFACGEFSNGVYAFYV